MREGGGGGWSSILLLVERKGGGRCGLRCWGGGRLSWSWENKTRTTWTTSRIRRWRRSTGSCILLQAQLICCSSSSRSWSSSSVPSQCATSIKQSGFALITRLTTLLFNYIQVFAGWAFSRSALSFSNHVFIAGWLQVKTLPNSSHLTWN